MDPARSMKSAVRAMAGAGVLALALMGCGDTDPPLGPTALSAWETNLAPVVPENLEGEFPLVTGKAAAIVRESGTEAAIELRPFEDSLVLEWALFHGSCATPGGRLGTSALYPQLAPSNLAANTWITDPLRSGKSYHVAVSDMAGERVSCGNLTELEL